MTGTECRTVTQCGKDVDEGKTTTGQKKGSILIEISFEDYIVDDRISVLENGFRVQYWNFRIIADNR